MADLEKPQLSTMDRGKKKLKKTAVFMAIDVVMVFILTWLWFYITEVTSVKEYSKGAQSAMYTVFITICFGIYYFLFDMAWRSIKGKIPG